MVRFKKQNIDSKSYLIPSWLLFFFIFYYSYLILFLPLIQINQPSVFQRKLIQN